MCSIWWTKFWGNSESLFSNIPSKQSLDNEIENDQESEDRYEVYDILKLISKSEIPQIKVMMLKTLWSNTEASIVLNN